MKVSLLQKSHYSFCNFLLVFIALILIFPNIDQNHGNHAPGSPPNFENQMLSLELHLKLPVLLLLLPPSQGPNEFKVKQLHSSFTQYV